MSVTLEMTIDNAISEHNGKRYEISGLRVHTTVSAHKAMQMIKENPDWKVVKK